jgi:two-component system response regulator AtoC
VDIPRLKSVLANLSRTLAMQQEIGSLRSELRRLGHFGAMIGSSPVMQKLYDVVSRVAVTDATVFLTGESGSGKEVVASTIHQLSPRRGSPFVALNCGAIPPNLIESELFGHERGSFTGATQQHRGYFERATHGTLFLDEVTEMPLELQVKLLRVLETSTVNRIGGDVPIAVDIRLIAATNRSPEEAVRSGRFREDLLYRLNVFPIMVPPLRERRGDAALLAEHFLAQHNQAEGTTKTLSEEALRRLAAYPWPGNVRELKNVIHREFILAQDQLQMGSIQVPGDARPARREPAFGPPGGAPGAPPPGGRLADLERAHIIATLEACLGDKKQAAEILGISLKTLYNRLNAYSGGD